MKVPPCWFAGVVLAGAVLAARRTTIIFCTMNNPYISGKLMHIGHDQQAGRVDKICKPAIHGTALETTHPVIAE